MSGSGRHLSDLWPPLNAFRSGSRQHSNGIRWQFIDIYPNVWLLSLVDLDLELVGRVWAGFYRHLLQHRSTYRNIHQACSCDEVTFADGFYLFAIWLALNENVFLIWSSKFDQFPESEIVNSRSKWQKFTRNKSINRARSLGNFKFYERLEWMRQASVHDAKILCIASQTNSRVKGDYELW